MAWITDSLRSAIASLDPRRRSVAAAPFAGSLTPQLALAAYLSSGLLRKVIDIPAADRVREWRDWQAEKDQIEALEAEERRLGLHAKVKQAEILRGIGGGALILAAPGDLAMPINARAIGKGGLAAVNVVSRWQLELVDIDDNLASPTFGQPQYFRIRDGRGQGERLHPSRVVAFRGDPLPAAAGISPDDAYWGASRLERVFADVQKSDDASRWFAELVRKAKLLRIGIPDLPEMLATQGGQEKLTARVATIAEGESVLNATVYSSAGANDAPGETISDYQVTWTGIPQMMDAFDQRVAAVADIPFTRLMGRSPAGMNATGKSDNDNWNKMVVAGQKLELRPCLEQMDEVLIRSAGLDPANVWWRFAPLETPTEAEEAATFKTTMEAVEKLRADASIPDVALNKAVQNLMSEREWLPGLDQALAEIPEEERFGLNPEPDDTDPSALTEGGDPDDLPEGGQSGSRLPARRANDGGAPTGGRPFDDARSYNRWPSGSARGGQFAPRGSGGFIGDLYGSPPANADAIEAATGLKTGHLSRLARAHELNHASRFSKRGRVPPSQSILRRYAIHAASAHAYRLQGDRSNGSGLRLRSEITIGKRSYTLIERVGERSGTLAFVTMWENV